jgi:hypothetical protein
VNYTFNSLGDFTGNRVEFRDPLTFDAVYKYSGGTPTANPENFTLFGCTDADYAQEFADYLWAVKSLRRKQVKFTTEMEGLLPSFGQRIAVSSPMPDWGQSGVFVDSIDALTWIVDQPLDWVGSNVIIIRSDTGIPSSPYAVTQGINPNIVVFAEVPPIVNQQGQEPTNYAFGTSTDNVADFIITKISPKDSGLVEIEAQVYNEEIYCAGPWQMGCGDICKQYECDSFQNALASTVDYLWLMDDDPIPAAMADINTGWELLITGNMSAQDSILEYPCVGEGGSMRGGGGSGGTANPADAQPAQKTGYTGSFGALYGPEGALSTNTQFTIFYDNNASTAMTIKATAAGNDLDVTMNWGPVQALGLSFPGGLADSPFVSINYTIQPNFPVTVQFEVFLNFVSAGTFFWDSTLNESLIQTGTIKWWSGGSGDSRMQYSYFSNSRITNEEMAVLADAWLQNQIGYIDPTPGCS